MKFLSLQPGLFFVIASILVITGSCKKDVTPENKAGNLEKNYISFVINQERRAMINQAVTVYDSSFLQADSAQFVKPTYSRTYEWTVIPDNGCYTSEGIKNKAAAEFIFHCTGSYSLTATIYDSLHNKIGTTDTSTIKITSDTLLPMQPIKAGDSLHVYPFIDSVYKFQVPHTTPPDRIDFYLFFETGKNYNTCFPATRLSFANNIDGNNYQFIFSGVTLPTYPFTYGPVYPMTSALSASLLNNITFGSTINLSVIWSGVTYTGKVTFTANGNYTAEWDNSGLVQLHL